ncbi:Fanconi anemia complementation group I [Arctopsyche grandis]|uniref:Fanconi anemia complementation group I n=1 Tax=Arctopsyche grandis TaxID=121162 RepID=UPI00406D6764
MDTMKASALLEASPRDLPGLVLSLTPQQLKTLIDSDLISSKGSEILDALLLGLSDDISGKKKRFTIIQLTLNKLRLPETPSHVFTKLLTTILLEISALTSDSLKTLADDCIESIRANNDFHTSWKDVLPACLRILSNRNDILDYCDTEITTSDFTSACVQSLIQAKWPLSNITSISIMFLDISLSKDEHYKIVNKLCCELENLSPDSLPPLVHHLLRLCKTQHSAIIYFRLSDYFNSRLYSMFRSKDTILQESESPLVGFDSIDTCPDEVIHNIEATSLYHVCRDSNALKKFLVVLKGIVHRPSAILMSPFLVQVLLASGHHKETCAQIIRSALYCNYYEELRRAEFTWCQDALPPVVDLKCLNEILIDNSKSHCHTTAQGLLDLSIALICTGGLTPVTGKLQKLGTAILVRFLKKHPTAAEDALKILKDKFASESSNIRCIAESFKFLFTYMPHKMMESTITLQNLLEDCFMLPEGRDWNEHRPIIESMNIIFKLDSRLRDTLVMICRKGLFSSDSRIGCLAVCSFLALVKSLKSSNSNSNASTQEMSLSILSQISMNAHSLSTIATGRSSRPRINNATICMEVVSILKRCFKQSAEVREQLYIELPNAIRGRSELQEPIMNMIYEHITYSNYYVSDTDALPPLLLDKCISIKDDAVTLQEPIGRLLFTIQKLLVCEHPAPGSDAPGGWSLSGAPEQFHGDAGKLYVILLSLANKMVKCSPMNFIQDDGVSLNEIGTESKTKCLILEQAILCCEALIAFRINEWKVTKEQQPQKLLNLLKVHSQILDFTKANSTKSKKDSNDKKNKSPNNDENDQNTTNNEKATKSKKGKKAALKFSDMAKNRNSGFKVPSSVWDLHTLQRSLELLYMKDVDWATEDQLSSVRNKRELHRLILKQGLSVFSQLKTKKLTQQQRTEMSNCSEILYTNCISRLDEFSDFDQETALLTIECFQAILHIVTNNHEEYLGEFLKITGNVESYEELGELVSTVAEKLGVQLESTIAGISLTEDPLAAKIPGVLFEVISTLLQCLPSNTAVCQKWADWLQKLGSKNCEDCKYLGSPVVSCLIGVIAKSAEPWAVCEVLVKKLSQIMGTDKEINDTSENESIKDFTILTPSSASAAFVTLSSHVGARISAVDTVIGRIKADHAFLQYRKTIQLPTARASLKNRERAICAELCRAAGVIRDMSIVLCPAGPCCDALLRLVSKLHATLAVLTSHFATREPQIIQLSRFDKLVKLCGRGMSKAIDSLIAHVEGARETSSKGAKAQARLLKDTKNIPRLVYNCELFYKRIHQLSSKTKIDLVCLLSKGSARDFRIKASDVKEALRNNNMDCEDVEDNVTMMEVDDINDNTEIDDNQDVADDD